MGSKLHPRNCFLEREALYHNKGGKYYVCDVQGENCPLFRNYSGLLSMHHTRIEKIFLSEMLKYTDTQSP